MDNDNREVGKSERSTARLERIGYRQRDDKESGHSPEQQQPVSRPIGGNHIGEPRVAAVHPPDHNENDNDPSETAQVRFFARIPVS